MSIGRRWCRQQKIESDTQRKPSEEFKCEWKKQEISKGGIKSGRKQDKLVHEPRSGGGIIIKEGDQ